MISRHLHPFVYRFSNKGRIMTEQLLKQQPGQVLFQKGPLFFFNPIINARFNHPTIVDGQELGIIIAILQKYNLGLLLQNNVRLSQNAIVEMTEQNKFYVDLSEKDVTMKSISLEQGQKSYPITILNYKHQRVCSKQQLFTGNIFQDLFQPLCIGQFLQIESKKYLNHIVKQFDTVIICGDRVKLETNEGQNVYYFKQDQDISSSYLLPKAALSVAQQEAYKHKTLLLYNNVTEHARANNSIQETILQQLHGDQYIASNFSYSSNLLGDISELCGYRENESNLTIIINQPSYEDASDVVQYQLQKDLDSMVIKVSHDHQVISPSPFNQQFQWPIIYQMAQSFYWLLHEYEQQRKQYLERQKLQIHIEPWDYYLYLDGKVWHKMIELLSKQDHTQYDVIVLLWWISGIVQEDLAGLLKDEPQIYLDSLIQFARSTPIVNQLTIYDLFYEMQNDLKERQDAESFISGHLNRLFQLHITHMKMNDLLLPFKKDYIQE